MASANETDSAKQGAPERAGGRRRALADRLQPRRAVLLVVPALILLLAAFRLYRSPSSASNLETTPDSVEYAIGAHRFAGYGRYEILIDGSPHPPRYPPWFSVLALAPIYAVAPGEIGNGILSVLGSSIVAVLCAYGIGRRLAGEGGGVGAALALLCVPAFSQLSRQIMTDVPALTFGLAGGWLFLGLRDRLARREDGGGGRPRAAAAPGDEGGVGAVRWPAFLLAGGLAAGCYAMRSEGAAVVLPFVLLALRLDRARAPSLLAVLAPTALMGLATALYNRAAFGSVFRTGYHYWCSVPYDYARLVFSPSYVSANARTFMTRSAVIGIGLGIAGLAALWVRGRRGWQPALVYLALAALPATALHMVYFYATVRFHVFAIALLAILGGAGLGGLLPGAIVRRGWPLWLLLGAAFVVPPREPDPDPVNAIAAETVARETPAGAVVLSGVTPVYLGWFLDRGAPRRVIPLSRSVEYARQVITPRRIPVLEPPPRGPTDHRAPALLRAGAREIYPIVASESRETIEAWLREGKRIFIDGSVPSPPDFDLKRFLGDTFELSVVGGHTWLAEVKLRSPRFDHNLEPYPHDPPRG